MLSATGHVTLIGMESTNPKMRTRYKGLIIACGLLVVVLAAGSYAYRHQTALIINTANRFLAAYNVRITDISGIVPGMSSLYVARLTVEMDTHDGTQTYTTEQRFQGVSVRFDARELLANQLREVAIDRATLRLPPMSASDDEADAFDMASLPFDRLRVDQLSLDGWLDNANLQITRTRDVTEIRFRTDSLSIPLSRLSDIPAMNALMIDSGISAEGHVDAAIAAAVRIHAGSDETDPSYAFNFDAARIALTLESLATPDWQLTQSALLATRVSARCNQDASCNVAGTTEIDTESLTAADLRMESLQIRGDLDIRTTGDSLQARLGNGSTLRFDHFETGDMTLSLVEATFADAFIANLDLPTRTTDIHARNTLLNLPLIRVPDSMLGMQLDVHDLALAYRMPEDPSAGFDLPALTINAHIDISQIYTNLVSLNMWPMRLTQRIRLHNQQFSGDHRLYISDREVLTASLTHDLRTQNGSGRFNVAGLELSATAPLSSVLSPMPWRADLVNGRIRANASINWTQLADLSWQLSGPVQLQGDGLAGYYEDIAFTGLTTSVDGNLLPDWQLHTSAMQSFTLASLDAGLSLTDISGRYRVDSTDNHVEIADLEISAFGGKITSEWISYRPDGTSLFTVELQAIDLRQLLSLSAYDSVAATGLISGTLPMQLRGTSPLVTGGRLRALPPGGTIRYGSGMSGTGNQSLDLVYQALQHYRYDILEAGVDYREDGELLLAVRMEGLSPELNQGQRINLNLNVSDNIPALLQSLQAGRSVTDALERQMSR